MTQPSNPSAVSAAIYDENYYLAHCDGYKEFSHSNGGTLPPRLAYAWEISQIAPNMRLLDIGFGRGEIFYQGHALNAQVFGIDFATAAVKIGQSVITEANLSGALTQADAKHIPFADNYFDRVLMFDVVEHLHAWELAQAYQEIWRVLKPEGQLIIHTAPNLWYYQFGYPVYRLIHRLMGTKLPANPRDRFEFHRTHVNEQSILTLKKQLSAQGFRVQSWLAHIPKEGLSLPLFARLVSPILYYVPPFLYVFRNDVLAIAEKPAQ